MFSTHDGSLGGMVQRSTLELKEKVCIDFFLIKNIRSKKRGQKHRTQISIFHQKPLLKTAHAVKNRSKAFNAL